MIPTTYPVNMNSWNVGEMLIYKLSSVVGMKRWSDYIPVKSVDITTYKCEMYDNDGYKSISELSSITGKQAWLDYIPVYEDAAATTPWQTNDVGYIPIGVFNNFNGFPAPAMKLDMLAGILDSRVTFTRASGATYTDSSGVIQLATSNTPRFDYDPVTLQPKGLLIEEQRTNLLTYSEQFDNAAWVGGGSSITANATTAPDGNSLADKLTGNGISGTHYTGQTYSFTATAYTFTCYVKKGTNNFVQFRFGTAAGGFYANFDLVSGTVGTTNATSSNIFNAGNGWFRCSITATTIAASSNISVLLSLTASDAGAASNTLTTDIYIWGAQLEAGSFATSYIPTTSAQATRAADVAVVTGTNFSSWYNQSEGTFYTEFDVLNVNVSGFWRVFSGDASLYPQLFSNAGNYNWTPSSDGLSGPGVPTVGIQKIACAYKVNDAASSFNGALGTSDTTVTLASPTAIKLGASYSVANRELNGHIKSLAFYNTRLTNAQLQTLTT